MRAAKHCRQFTGEPDDRSDNSWLVEDAGPKPKDIILDGESQKGKALYFADAEKGIVKRYRTNANGGLMIGNGASGLADETLSGKVEIIW